MATAPTTPTVHDGSDDPGDAATRRRGRLRAAALVVALALAAIVLGAAAPPASAEEDLSITGVAERDDEPGSPLDSRAKVNWGIVSGTVYFSPRETRNISKMTGVGAACGFFAGVPVAGPFLVAGCGLYWATWVGAAGIAVNNYQCIKIKFGAGYASLPVFRYSGGYCTK